MREPSVTAAEAGTGRYALVDNDIVLKSCAWTLGGALIDLVQTFGPVACLSVARWSIASRLQRWRALQDRARAAADFDGISDRISWLEPDGDEVLDAAELEERALRTGLELDPGESLLAAIAMRRGSALLATGDKRAILALSALCAAALADRIACLEQILDALCARLGQDEVGAAVCQEPVADRAAALAFSCGGAGRADPAFALASYIGHLRSSAPTVLVDRV
jgi:predicted nucleic acid-binding protein